MRLGSRKYSGSNNVDINYFSVLPEIVLSIVGMIIMFVAAVVPAPNQRSLGYLAILGILLATACAVLFYEPGSPTFFGMVYQDSFGLFCRLLFLFSSGSVALVSIDYLERDHLPHGEFFALLLFATVGMSLMALSSDLILTFLGLEILSIATYILAGFRRDDVKSGESALKYFLLGSLSTAFLLYGIAFIYGATGSLKYPAMAHAVEGADRFVALLLGLGLLVVGFGFKAALVPFHIWTPDVYEGAPIPVTAHLAVSSKAAAFLAFVRILHQVLPGLGDHWQTVLWVSAFLTMLIGNIVALSQTNIKRMLAYSSIAHAGYLLVGIVARNETGVEALLFYLGSYALMTLGAFAVVQLIGGAGERRVGLDDFRGVGQTHPFLAACLTIFLLSLAGIPATAGFMGKLFLFSAAIQAHLYWLVVIALLASAIGLYYYLRIIVLMYMREPNADGSVVQIPVPVGIAIVIMLVGTLGLGLYPGPFLQLASEAASF